jgi:hypothetical protein
MAAAGPVRSDTLAETLTGKTESEQRDECSNMNDADNEIIIRGLTSAGRTFRPSDWAERLSGVLSTFGQDHRMSYSPYVRPVTQQGVKCVVVNTKLAEYDERAYNFLLSFARDNDLQIDDSGIRAA